MKDINDKMQLEINELKKGIITQPKNIINNKNCTINNGIINNNNNITIIAYGKEEL